MEELNDKERDQLMARLADVQRELRVVRRIVSILLALVLVPVIVGVLQVVTAIVL